MKGPFSLTFLLTGWLWPLPQLAMTHPSHHLNFGMNPDHARNSLSNCGIRQPKYGDRKVHHMYMRKKGGWLLFSHLSSIWPQPLCPWLPWGFSFFQASTLWSTSCPAWDRTTPPPPGMSSRNRLNKLGKLTETSSFKANFFLNPTWAAHILWSFSLLLHLTSNPPFPSTPGSITTRGWSSWATPLSSSSPGEKASTRLW